MSVGTFVGGQWRKHRLKFLVTLFLLVLAFVFFAKHIFFSVGPGEGGVLYRRFFGGTDVRNFYGEGMHVIFPWDRFFIYDLKVHEKRTTVRVLSENGLMISVYISYRYRPLREELPLLHQQVGVDYERKVVDPSIVSSIREIIGMYEPEQIYTIYRHTIQEEVLQEARAQILGKHVEIDDVIIQNVQLPAMINAAIEAKLCQEQKFKEYKFRILQEEQERERKRIEAEGIHAFQEIVQNNLTTKMLIWRGIQATVDLAKSENAKVVVIGNSGQGGLGLPIIMGGEWSRLIGADTAADGMFPPDAPASSDAADEGSGR